MGDGMLSLYWNNHRATFCHILATLREKERYTDATIACDGKFYPVHKLVLSTCSEYFEKMFEHTPCKHPVIVLKDIKADALEALLNYMYAGYVNVAQNDLARLIKAAETLSIKGLAVPDEPPLGEESKPNQTKTSREDRLSPQPKRRRRDENGSSQPSNSPPSSPRVSSPFPVDSEHSHPRSRTHSESHRTDRIDSLDQPLDHPPLETQSSDVKVPVVVDESLVKEEMVDSVDNNPSEDMESGLHYGSVGGEDGLDSGGGGEDHSGHMLPNKYDQPVIPGQGQPLADAVAEALAGPSGMQGWLGGSELGGGGGYSAESYGGDASQEGPPHPNAPGPPHAQQRATYHTAGRKSSRDAKWSKSVVMSPHKTSRISTEAEFIPKRPRNLPFHGRKRKPSSKGFFYGQGKFSNKSSFRYDDKMWYEQLLRSSTLPQGMAIKPGRSASSWNSRNIGPVSMISRSRCSSTWTQEKRQQMETPMGQAAEEFSSDENIFRIPKPPVKLDTDDPRKENLKPDGESEEDASLKNSLEASLQSSPIYNLDWLKSLRSKYEVRAKTADCDAAVLAEAQRLLEEKRKKSQASLDSCMSLRMKHLDLTYPGQIQAGDEEDEYEEELVQLTQEMEDIIDSALQKGPPNQILIDRFNTQITRHDISTLAGLNWLNDEVINFYMNLLMERGKTDNYPSVHAFNTFFYPKLMKQGFASIKRWTKRVDLFSHDIILIPVHLGMHWCLATIDMRSKYVRYYDSMLGDNDGCLEALLKYLFDEHQDKKSSPLDMDEWMSENVKDIPQQMNGSDCGMFACMFSEYLSRDALITFDQQHMPYFRRKMVYEIVRATLL